MTAVPTAAPVMARPLVLTERVRAFRHDGRDYAHVSALPLSYLGMSAGFAELLGAFGHPRRPVDVWPGPVGQAERFFGTLVRAGVLQVPDNPDPVHDYRRPAGASRVLYLYPTNSCNLRCVYCYATSGPGAGPRLSREHALIAVDDFFDTLDDSERFVTLRFHGGGEPTTNFPVMLAAWQRFRQQSELRGLRCSVTTITNGTFGPAVLRELVKPEWMLNISYDGPRQGAQRPTAAGADSRGRVVANIAALRAAGKWISTRATVTREGLPHLRGLVDDAADLGIDRVQVEPASMVGRGADLLDGPPDALEFAEAFLDAFGYALRSGVRLGTSAWSHTRIGDGRYCGAIAGARALTPDGSVSACTEVCSGEEPGNPFLVGRLDAPGRRLEIWPVREQQLASRVGYDLPDCRSCFMVDTCAGGCAAKAQVASGDPMHRDAQHCAIARYINPRIMAELADGALLPDAGWQPFSAELREPGTGMQARMVALVPPSARRRWNADPERRPAFPVPLQRAPFFHLPGPA